MLDGYVHPDFGAVASMLTKQMPKEGFGGSHVTIYHRGEKVVDVWGGTRNQANDPWDENTIALSFSTTKGIASTVLHILIDEGKAAYDDPVAKYWPEFVQAGKGAITIRQVMCHEAGLYRIRDMIDSAPQIKDWDHMVDVLAKAAPAHTPGEKHGYHGLTYGWLVGEIVARIEGKPFKDVMREKLVSPLGLDGLMYCGIDLQDHEAHGRRADLTLPPMKPDGPDAEEKFQRTRKFLKAISFSKIDIDHGRAALGPKVAEGDTLDWNDNDLLASSIPAANGVFSARALAKVYAALANGGEIDGVRILSEDAVRKMGEIQNRTSDLALIIPMQWRLGYHRVMTYPLIGPKAKRGFGHAGFGGSGAWCDPERNLALGLTLNSGVGTPTGDGRIVALGRAAMKCADKRKG